MQWLKRYQLVLFDFDGLLVNTESIQREAYARLLREHGFDMPWTFQEYCEVSHATADGVRDGLFKVFPDLPLLHPDWKAMHTRKTELAEQLIEEGSVELMPGVRRFLNKVVAYGIKRAVVTHSPRRLVAAVRRSLPELECIPRWYTREDFQSTKPDPEGYLKAINDAGIGDGAILGFEDSPRGIQALQGTPATAVAVCPLEYPDPQQWLPEGVPLFRSFNELMVDNPL